MTVKQRKPTSHKATIDLTALPYFADAPRALDPASDENTLVIPDYREDRPPSAFIPGQRYAGIGLAAVMDVGAHPIRAKLRRINVMAILAITVVAGIAILFATLVATFRH
jgi:hypothetical protein